MQPNYDYDGTYLSLANQVQIGPSNYIDLPWNRGYMGHYIQLVQGFKQPSWQKDAPYLALDWTVNFYVHFRLYGEAVWAPRPVQRRSIFYVPADVMFLQETLYLDYPAGPPAESVNIRVFAPLGSKVTAFQGAAIINWE